MPKTISDKAFPHPEHDHDMCLETAIQKAKKTFESNKLRLTPLRENVLREILNSHRALGAYEILERLKPANQKIAPITIYRILDLLLDLRLIHRLETQNTYYACHHAHHSSNSFVTMICKDCGEIAELIDKNIEKAFEQLEAKVSFAKESRTLEVEGLCPNCQLAK